MISRIINFFERGVWMVRSHEMPFCKRAILNTTRVLMLTGRFFVENQCTVKASALTYYTLFSIVPILALAFGIAKGYGYAEFLEQKLRETMEAYPDLAENIITFADNLLQKTKGGLIAGVGVLLLIWTAVKLLSNIEMTMNGIWGVKRGRTLLRKVTDYITILLFCPILMLAAWSGIVFATTQLGGLTKALPFSSALNAMMGYAMGALPLLAVWIVFTFIYVVIPNTKVRLRAALPAGFLAAMIYLLVQSMYILAQFVVVQYNTIYGSFAALPLFLIWLNLSWIILLAGAELAFAIQNVSEYEMIPEDQKLSLTQKNIYAMELISRIVDAFEKQEQPLTDEQLSMMLEIPIRTTRRVLYEMVSAGLICEVYVKDESNLRAYQVAVPVRFLTPMKVVHSLEDLGGIKLENDLDKRYYDLIVRLRQVVMDAPENQSLILEQKGS